ncbi:MAG: hypothetical protein LV479_12250 [Methylacidiphilales bacterium]|nr:hypothetical protein [Candidatus Methylacidiphilales bacterium]
MIVNSISDLNMHDSELLRVLIERTEVTMFLDYIEEYDPLKSSPKKLVFRECTNLVLTTHLGYASPDSILAAEEINLGSSGRKFRITTNTTATTIEIIANIIELIDVE